MDSTWVDAKLAINLAQVGAMWPQVEPKLGGALSKENQEEHII